MVNNDKNDFKHLKKQFEIDDEYTINDERFLKTNEFKETKNEVVLVKKQEENTHKTQEPYIEYVTKKSEFARVREINLDEDYNYLKNQQYLVKQNNNQPYQHTLAYQQKTYPYIPKAINNFILDEQNNQQLNNKHLLDEKNEELYLQLKDKVEQKKESIPSFYLKEINAVKIKIALWTILLLIGIAAISYMVYEVVVNSFNPWIFLPLSVYSVFMIFFLALNISNLINFKSELKYQKNNFDKQKATNFIIAIYRKLVVSHINVNWFCSYIYLVCAFVCFIVFSISYFMNVYYNGGSGIVYGDLIVKHLDITTNKIVQNYNLLYAIIFCGCLVCLTIIIHLWLIFQAHHRINRMHSFYVQEIISGDEIIKLKKQANRRGLIIFLVLTVILGLIFFIIYKILQKKFVIKKA